MALLMLEVNMKVSGLWSVKIVKGRRSIKYIIMLHSKKDVLVSRK